jgi:hypothetical protein
MWYSFTIMVMANFQISEATWQELIRISERLLWLYGFRIIDWSSGKRTLAPYEGAQRHQCLCRMHACRPTVTPPGPNFRRLGLSLALGLVDHPLTVDAKGAPPGVIRTQSACRSAAMKSFSRTQPGHESPGPQATQWNKCSRELPLSLLVPRRPTATVTGFQY